MGLREVMRVSTTNFRPGALLITLQRGDGLDKGINETDFV